MAISQKIGIFAIALAVFLGGGLFLVAKRAFFPSSGPAAPEKIQIPREFNEEEIREFLGRYLDAYKNAREKKNYGELEEFLTQEAAGFFSEEWLTDVDDYQIGEISRPAFLSGEGERYAARVKILKNGLPINPPTGETWPVFIVREKGGLKIQTWFFNLPM